MYMYLADLGKKLAFKTLKQPTGNIQITQSGKACLIFNIQVFLKLEFVFYFFYFYFLKKRLIKLSQEGLLTKFLISFNEYIISRKTRR